MKEARKTIAFAKLNNCPTSPRKMRLIADLIRGMDVDLALNTLKFDAKIGSKRMEKLVLSAISNWQEKNKDQKIEDADLFIKEIFVNGGKMIKEYLDQGYAVFSCNYPFIDRGSDVLRNGMLDELSLIHISEPTRLLSIE